VCSAKLFVGFRSVLSEVVCPWCVWNFSTSQLAFGLGSPDHLHIAACGVQRGYLGLSGAPSLPACGLKTCEVAGILSLGLL
jgi:hypothetical protein